MLAVDTKVFENTNKNTFIGQKRRTTESEEEGGITESEEEWGRTESEEEEENILSESEEEEIEMAEPSVEQINAILDVLILIRSSKDNPEYGVLNGVIADYTKENIYEAIADEVNRRLNIQCLRMDKRDAFNMVSSLQKTYMDRGVKPDKINDAFGPCENCGHRVLLPRKGIFATATTTRTRVVGSGSGNGSGSASQNANALTDEFKISMMIADLVKRNIIDVTEANVAIDWLEGHTNYAPGYILTLTEEKLIDDIKTRFLGAEHNE
ncbi:uncharacterized protein LOC110708292 [Chenopodium quinoa]|uniref:uncharacterized protein LOC110708292 n=1 Tax=Chenopodium quinoa TaxID=63459 RepID=UPI000B78936B|nr:uncharacterized protein LOC110708292 [Chenopodium quinoa]